MTPIDIPCDAQALDRDGHLWSFLHEARDPQRIVVGATFTGPEIQEALHAATIAVVAEVTLDDLWHAVPSFPTRSELWLRLLEAHERF